MKTLVCVRLYSFFVCYKTETRSSTVKMSKRKTTKQISSDADANDSATSEEFHSDSTQSVKKMPVTTNSK